MLSSGEGSPSTLHQDKTHDDLSDLHPEREEMKIYYFSITQTSNLENSSITLLAHRVIQETISNAPGCSFEYQH